MTELVSALKSAFYDRIQWMALLIVLCFVSVLLLSSQSAASYPTYLLAFLMLLFFSQWRDVFNVNLVRWVVLLLIWLSLSAFWSDPFDLRQAISIWIRALLVFCFVAAFAECQLRGQLQRWMGTALTVVGAVAAVAAIVNFYLTNPHDGRLNGLGQLDTHVVAALVYGVVLLFVLRFAMDERRKALRGLAFVVAAIIVVAVALSDSRNAWVAVSLGVIALVLSLKVEDPRQYLLALCSGALILGVSLLVIVSTDAGRELLLPRGLSYRPTIWASTLDRVLAESLLFGAGIVTKDAVTSSGMVFDHPHNMYLAVLFQGGAVGLVLYVTVLWKSARALLNHYGEPSAKLALAVLTIAVSAHFLDGHELIDKVGDTWFLVWLPVAIAAGLSWRPGR